MVAACDPDRGKRRIGILEECRCARIEEIGLEACGSVSGIIGEMGRIELHAKQSCGSSGKMVFGGRFDEELFAASLLIRISASVRSIEKIILSIDQGCSYACCDHGDGCYLAGKR